MRPTQTLIALDDQEAPVGCVHCGVSSHYYKAAVDWTTFDTRGYERGDCVVWYRVEREHLKDCCRNGCGHEERATVEETQDSSRHVRLRPGP